MVQDLTESKWRALADSVRNKSCTPFLGAGAAAGTLPTAVDLARSLAMEEGYPLPDRDDLMRVVQYIGLQYEPLYAKELLLEKLKQRGYPDFSGEEPHYALASMKLPVYLTTNYDDFMVRALGAVGRDCRRDYCRWTQGLGDIGGGIWERGKEFNPTPEVPLVYHLHGQNDVPASLVVTEDDYIDYLYNIVASSALAKTADRAWDMFPPPVQNSISQCNLVFLGYRLGDWNFRVIFRWLVQTLGRSQRKIKVAVQLKIPDRMVTVSDILSLGPIADLNEANMTSGSCLALVEQLEERRRKLSAGINELWLRHAKLSRGEEPDPKRYIADYFDEVFDVSVFFGTAQEFVTKLRSYL
jgi:hypothetical protein